MSSDIYCKSAAASVEETLKKKSLRLPSKCPTPLANYYRLEIDTTPEIKSDGLQYYQDLVGVLRWAI